MKKKLLWSAGIIILIAVTILGICRYLEVHQRQTDPNWKLAEQLARINEQLVIKNRRAKRIWTAIVVIVAGAILLQLLALGGIVLFRAVTQNG